MQMREAAERECDELGYLPSRQPSLPGRQTPLLTRLDHPPKACRRLLLALSRTLSRIPVRPQVENRSNRLRTVLRPSFEAVPNER